MNKQGKTPLTISVTTLGCKVNQCESESIYAEFQQPDPAGAGTRKVCSDVRREENSPDICVINTCTVTQKASMQSRQAIRKVIRDNPKAIIIATGCYAQSEPHELAKIQGLDYIIGNTDKHRIARIFQSSGKPRKNVEPMVVCHDIMAEKCLHGVISPLTGNRTRPFIKIQDGCDNFCSYCIVPFTRGPSRSLLPDQVMNILHDLPPDKKKEIVLTGIHLGRYGLDHRPQSSLLALLKKIQTAEIVERIRLSSLEPVEISDDLLKWTADSEIICRHFHVPLQSGDASVLKRMNRSYDPALFEKLIIKIHRTLPDAAIGVDVLIGFPGETDQAFENTVHLLNSLPITYVHAFPFSSRPGTKASTYPDPVDVRLIKKRRNQILALGREKKYAFYEKMTGQTLDVLIEEKRESVSGRLTGISSNYVRVLIDGGDSLKNEIVPCRILKTLHTDAVLGEHLKGAGTRRD